MSPLYGIRYYNGYGWNFYYRMGDYYATTPNAPVPSSNGSGEDIPVTIIFPIGICLFVMCYKKKNESGSEEIEEETVVEVVETRTEDNIGTPGQQMGYIMGNQ
jgi:hypothetical protein